MLGVLLSILAFNFVDRLALGLVLQDIKADLRLSDTQLGLLSGIAFAFFYSFMGIPIARWADRGNRVTIISITTVLWSAAAALTGTAGNFLQMLLLRVGAAVGEAGCVPPAHSLIADYFTRAERPRAVAIYMLGGQLSVFVGYFAAGWLNEFYGWRLMFTLLSLPGAALAVLAWLTLREPRCQAPAEGEAGGRLAAARLRPPQSGALLAQPTLKEVGVRLWSNVTFRHLVFCFSVTSFFSYGIGQWMPVFFIRSYALDTGELGTWLAVIWGMAGALGMYWGGEAASRHARHDERLQLKVMASVFCGSGILSAFIYLAPNPYVAFAFMGVVAVANATCTGPLLAMLQSLVPDRMRALSVALIFLFANLIGMGLGPLAAGTLSDALRPTFGEESLRYALLALCPGYLWGGWHLFRARRTVSSDLEVACGERAGLES